jgi:alpha-beta hydrolase superfamily lysophospholipase
VIGLPAAAFIALNGLAYMHARAMTHFTERGAKTSRPEDLTVLQRANVLLTGVRIPKPHNSETPADRGMPYDTHQFSGADGIEYEAWHVPCIDSRGLCILFHGYASCKCSLLSEAEVWREAGYETLLVDFRGSGGSSGQETTIGFLEADDVAVAFEYALGELTDAPPILYGRSMGAAAVLRAIAVHGLEPLAVVIEAPFDRLLATAENRFAAMGIPAFPSAQLLVFWGGVQEGFNGFEHNPAVYAEQVACPVLLLHGAEDPRVTREQATAVFEGLAGPKELVLFEGVGHESCLDVNPDEWRGAVTKFVSSVDQSDVRSHRPE